MKSCQTNDIAVMNCASILTSNDIHENEIGLYIMALFVLCISYRTLGVFILYEKAKRLS